MKENNKLKCFQYILFRLIEWYKQEYPLDKNLSGFSRLKALKLLFFVSTIKDKDSNNDLLDIFDKFFAMQYGPVESEVYEAIVKNNLGLYSFKNSIHVLVNKNNIDINDFQNIKAEYIYRMDKSIFMLKSKNKNLIKYSSHDLVELSHRWNSWSRAFKVAHLLNKGSMMMDISDIRNDEQYFD